MKDRSKNKDGRSKKPSSSSNGGDHSLEWLQLGKQQQDRQNERLVPSSHTNRPYFDHAPSLSRGPNVSYHSEPNYSRAGIGVVFRDADSSARALQELAQKRQDRAERRRAAILIGMLVSFACSVHIITRSPLSRNNNNKRSNSNSNSNNNAFLPSGRGTSSNGVVVGATGGSLSVASGGNVTRPPSVLDNLVDSMAEGDGAIPFFFHVPRSGGQTIKEIAGLCLHKVQTSEVGVREGHASDTTLSVVTIDNAKYINVDTTSKEGIARAAMMGFATNKDVPVHLVTSSYFLNVAKHLFTHDRPGRSFLMMRHPVSRAVSMYHYQKSNGELDEKVTLEDFARGNGIENNWMTRFLTNAMEGELKKSHLDAAKKILSKKFVVGFLDDAAESVVRMMKYYGWHYDEQDETKALMQQDCVAKKLADGTNRQGDYEVPKKGSQAHSLIAWQTQFDMKLYEFAKQLFEVQTNQYGSKERKKELKKKRKDKTTITR